MSYILDALRRAEAERGRGGVPGLHSQAVLVPGVAPVAERPTASVTAFDEDAHARLLAIRARYDGRSMMRANHRIEG